MTHVRTSHSAMPRRLKEVARKNPVAENDTLGRADLYF